MNSSNTIIFDQIEQNSMSEIRLERQTSNKLRILETGYYV